MGHGESSPDVNAFASVAQSGEGVAKTTIEQIFHAVDEVVEGVEGVVAKPVIKAVEKRLEVPAPGHKAHAPGAHGHEAKGHHDAHAHKEHKGGDHGAHPPKKAHAKAASGTHH